VKGLKSAQIDEAVADKRLYALSLIRNLLLHTFGVAGSVYVQDRKGVPGNRKSKKVVG
jgi:hypothetical protein